MKILVTGGTGTLGKAIVQNLILNPRILDEPINEIRILSRNEKDQNIMKLEFEDKLEFSICDVRDYEAIYQALNNQDIVIHAAAIKHIDVAETNPEEAIKTNVSGTHNVLKAAIRQEIRKLVNISTDKTCNPHSTYGATKLIAERLTSAKAIECKREFFTCRFGNILGSSGSVFSYWKNLINSGKDVNITHPEMTRFFILIETAAQFVVDALKGTNCGQILVPKLNSFSMLQIASILLENQNRGGINEIGLRPGEKIHEDLVNESEFQRATFSHDFLMLPPETIKYTDDNDSAKYGENIDLINEGCLRSDSFNDLIFGTERFVGKYAIKNDEMMRFLSKIPD